MCLVGCACRTCEVMSHFLSSKNFSPHSHSLTDSSHCPHSNEQVYKSNSPLKKLIITRKKSCFFLLLSCIAFKCLCQKNHLFNDGLERRRHYGGHFKMRNFQAFFTQSAFFSLERISKAVDFFYKSNNIEMHTRTG